MLHTDIQALLKAKHTRELNHILVTALGRFGIRSLAFTFYTQFPTSQGSIQYSYATEPLRNWHEYYLANHFEDTDQTLQANKRALEPIHWDVNQQLETAKSNKETRLREESLAQGIRRGISFPIHGPSDDFASLVIHERLGESCFQGIKPHLHEIHILGYYYYTQLKKIMRREKKKDKMRVLTPREYQCLKLTKEGLSAEEIAQHIFITKRTVHFHIQNAMKKLGVHHKYQAANKLS